MLLNFSVSLKFFSRSLRSDSSDSNFTLFFTKGLIQESKKSSLSSLFFTKTSIVDIASRFLSFNAISDEIGVFKISL